MLRDIQYLVIGNIFLTVGLIGYFTGMVPLALGAMVVAVFFFVRQLVKIYQRDTITK